MMRIKSIQEPKLKVSKPVVLFRDQNLTAMFPSLAKVRNRIILSFRAAPKETSAQQHLHPRSTIYIAHLNAQLKMEHLINFPIDIMCADQDPNLHVLENDKLVLSSFSWRPVVNSLFVGKSSPSLLSEKSSGNAARFWGAFTSISADGGYSWSKRQYMPELPSFPPIVKKIRPWHGGRQRGQLAKTHEGTLLIGTYDRKSPKLPFSSFLFRSEDQGDNWNYAGKIFSDPEKRIGVAEPTIVTNQEGKLFVFHRTFGAADNIAVSVSCDGAKSWSGLHLTGIIGHPCQICNLGSDCVFIVYARRNNPSSIRGRFLDLNKSEISSNEIIISNDAPIWDIGYPALVRLDSTRILVAYYWVDNKGLRYIEGKILTMV